MENLEKIEIKNLCPMIAMISAGKTSILNTIYDIDFLEATAGIGTKFVNIIRYNPNVGKNPKFYHLVLKPIGNGDYEYYKDPKTEVIGKEEIKLKNKQKNEELKEKDIPYTDLFYMVEVGESNIIEDKEYLKNFDLVDVPGVSEYRPPESKQIVEKPKDEEIDPETLLENELLKSAPLPLEEKKSEEEPKSTTTKPLKASQFCTIEEEMKTYKAESEQNYLTEIFKIIKNKMKNGIIVFSIDNYQHVDNYRIIGKLQKIINKPIENFLVLLNKIDKSEDRDYDIATLKAKIFENFPSAREFNFTKNTIIPCSKIQLENETKMNKSFKHLIYFHFINFLINAQKESSTSSTPTPNSYNFIDFLKKKLDPKTKKKKFIESINKIVENESLSKILEEIKNAIGNLQKEHMDSSLNLGVREDEFEEEEIKKIPEDLKGDDDDEDQEDNEDKDNFNIHDQEGNSIILYYYSEFKNGKLIPPKSTDTINIIKYFTMKNMEKNMEKEIKEIEEQLKENEMKDKSLNDQIDGLSKRMMEFYDNYKAENIKPENLETLRKNINSSIGIFKTSKLLYIPMLGVSNAGKSTILNGIIGCTLLPAHKNECTKKGILIKYWDNDYPVIRKTRFHNEKMGEDDIYYFEPDTKIIARGLEDIHQVLEGSNGKFIDNEEDFFYEIDIKIKFIYDLKLDDSLKEKICFIDLPGFGTNNKFETEGTYAHLMKSCNIFLFIVFNLRIKENDNQKMLENLYNQMSKFRDIPISAFVKKCLFIINCDKDQDKSEKSINQAKNDIIKAINGLKNDDKENINVCFFNAKYYENYVFKFGYYNSIESLIHFEYTEYLRAQDKFWKGLLDKIKGSTFNKYLIEQLKDNVKSDIKEKKFEEKKVNPDDNIVKTIEDINKYNELSFKEKEIILISKLISFGKDNISNSKLLLESNIETFTKELLLSIQKAKKKEDEEINFNLKRCFNIMDELFGLDPTQKYGNFRDAPIVEMIKPQVDSDINEFKEKIENLVKEIDNDFSKNSIVQTLEKCKNDLIDALKNEKNNIEKSLKSNKWKTIQTNFENIFKEKTKTLHDELLNKLETCSNDVNNHYRQCFNLLNQFYANSQSPTELLFKNFVSDKLGRDNDIKKSIEDIENDILAGAKTSTDWDKKKSFWDGIKTKFSDSTFLNKVIVYMIDNSTSKISSFINSSSNIVSEFKSKMTNEINSKKQLVINVLNERKKEEENKIKEQQMKSEEEKKKWEEEKKADELKKKKWEETCKKYRDLRYEITLLRLTSN